MRVSAKRLAIFPWQAPQALATEPTAGDDLPRPYEGINGIPRDADDLLSLEEEAMPRRRRMVGPTNGSATRPSAPPIRPMRWIWRRWVGSPFRPIVTPT